MALVVQKFGGTSVADPERIREVADHVARTRRRGDDVVLVVSAMGKETDELIRLASAVSKVRPGREMDMLITGGERKATALVCMALHDIGVPADSFTGSQAGFITDDTHTNAKIVELRPDRLRAALAAGRTPVIGGAQGVSADAHDVTFLGRGGSDTTAVALAHALDADSCELYTDVSGVFNADPRVVPGARRMQHVSFDEMLEMTANGCPKPAMRCVEFARTWNVRLHVRSAFTWEPGTWVQEEDPSMEQAIVSAVVHDTSEAKVTVSGVPDQPGIAAKLFRLLADRDVNVDMIVQNVSDHGVTDISFTVPHDELGTADESMRALATELGATVVTTDQDIARVSLVGAGMKSNPGVAAKTFEVLASAGINIEMISTSAIRISCIVREAEVEKAVQLLHDAFELG
ncbi:MAG: aspartate kinase [Actinomycetota bacterium]|nr:aspartate kinase [Actinomycetota bacterium]